MLLACAASSAQAQEPVLLRLQPAVGQVTLLTTDLETWLQTPALPQADTTQPTVRIRLAQRRLIEASDSTGVTFSDYTDSSGIDMPAARGIIPWLSASNDLLTGLRTRTRVDAAGRGVMTEVLEAPAVPPELPNLIRGVIALAVTGTRLSTFALPTTPVRPGDTWTDSLRYDLERAATVEASVVGGGGRGEATFRFERLERRRGARVAVVSAQAVVDAVASETAAAATMRFTGTAVVELDLDAGRVAASRMEMTGPLVTRLGTIPVRLVAVQQGR